MFDFAAWFFNLGFPAQIAVGAGSIALAVLSIILAVYIIKWTILAVVWIIKGIAKSIAWGFKKISEAVTSPCCAPMAQVEKSPFTPVAKPSPAPSSVPAPTGEGKENVPRFCAHCGNHLAPNIRNRLASAQGAFCPQCGMRLTEEGNHAPEGVQA